MSKRDREELQKVIQRIRVIQKQFGGGDSGSTARAPAENEFMEVKNRMNDRIRIARQNLIDRSGAQKNQDAYKNIIKNKEIRDDLGVLKDELEVMRRMHDREARRRKVLTFPFGCV